MRSPARYRKYLVVWNEGANKRRAVVMAPSQDHARKIAPWPTWARSTVRVAPYTMEAVRAFGGVRAHHLYTADFVVARKVGLAPGQSFRTGAAHCDIPKDAPPENAIIPFPAARDRFMSTVAQYGATGATVLPGWGMWIEEKVEREPSFVGQVSWMPRRGFESLAADARTFQRRMTAACQELACRFSQKEVLLRLQRPGKAPLFLRCSPTGKPAPPRRF